MHFWNLHIRSDRDPQKVQGTCMHQWIKSNHFDHPHPGKIEKFKPVECPDHEIHEKFCGPLTKSPTQLKNCVIDRCMHFPKVVERKVQKRHQEENKKKLKVPSGPPPPKGKVQRRCHLIADPHGLSLLGDSFEAQTVGDWVAYHGPRLLVSYRGVKMNPYPWVGIMDYFATLDGHIVKTHWNGKGVDVTIDGTMHDMDQGGKVAWGRTSISWSSAGIKLQAPGEEADLDFINVKTPTPWWKVGMHFWNLYIRSERDPQKVQGTCMHQWIKSNHFDHPRPSKIEKFKPVECSSREVHEKFCRFTKIPLLFRNCVYDRCLHFPTFVEKKIAKRYVQQMKKKIKFHMKPRVDIKAIRKLFGGVQWRRVADPFRQTVKKSFVYLPPFRARHHEVHRKLPRIVHHRHLPKLRVFHHPQKHRVFHRPPVPKVFHRPPMPKVFHRPTIHRDDDDDDHFVLRPERFNNLFRFRR